VTAELLIIATVDQVAAAFAAADAPPTPAPDPTSGTAGEVTPAQERSATWTAVAAAGLAHMSLAGRIGDYTGADLSPSALARWACDSPIRRIMTDHHGAVLHYGTSRRLATPHQKKALAVRDGGCLIPTCTTPPDWCDVHHITPWATGGTTDIDTMTLLCGHHHTAVHAGVYALRTRDGIPWIRLPSWQHPHQPWVRNPTTDHPQALTELARHLTDHLPLWWDAS
jgi:hypothetical protein